MFEQVFDNLRKATESSIQMQQEMYQKWMSMLPAAGAPVATTAAATAAGAAWESVSKAQKKWEEMVTDTIKRQHELVEAHYQAGLKSLEDLFRVGQSKSPQEIQERVVELYRKAFESLRQLSESQLKEFKVAVERLTELMTKAA